MTEWIQNIIDNWGAFGVAFLMFLENIFPPIPSEIVLPLAGYRAADGQLSLAYALLAGTAGSVIGVSLWYVAARSLGKARLKKFAVRHGRFLTLAPEDIEKVNDWFNRHGGKALLIGRLVPGIRTLISIPAGFAGMSLPRFLVLTTIGCAVWNTILIMAGYTLGARFEEIQAYVSPVGNLVIGGALGYYLYRVFTFKAGRDKS